MGDRPLHREEFDDDRLQVLPHGRPIRPQLNIPKTLSYDGTGKWRSFKMKFTKYADECDWGAHERRDRLCYILKGKASDFYTHVLERNPEVEYFALMSKFEKRFDFCNLTETLVLEFHQAEQEVGESLEEWGERVVDLSLRAYNEMPDGRMYNMAVVRFCQGLTDRDAGASVCNQQPVSIESAINKVRWFQHNRNIMKRKSVRFEKNRPDIMELPSPDSDDSEDGYRVQRISRPEVKPDRWLYNRASNFKRVNTGNDSSDSKELKDLMKSMGGKLDLVVDSLTKMTTMLGRQTIRDSSPMRSNMAGSCYHCGKTGHFRNTCPTLP